MYRAVSQQVMQIWGRAYPQALSEVLQLSAEIPSVQGLYMYNQQNTHSTGCAWVPVSCLTALSGDDTTLGSALSAEAPSLVRNALPSAGILLASACCLSPPIEQSLMMPSVDVSQQPLPEPTAAADAPHTGLQAKQPTKCTSLMLAVPSLLTSNVPRHSCDGCLQH